MKIKELWFSLSWDEKRRLRSHALKERNLYRKGRLTAWGILQKARGVIERRYLNG